MTRVGSFEAKTHLSELLQKVQQGESIEITRRGVPIAVLSPAGKVHSASAIAAAQAIRKIAKRNTLSGLKLKELICEGRRY